MQTSEPGARVWHLNAVRLTTQPSPLLAPSVTPMMIEWKMMPASSMSTSYLRSLACAAVGMSCEATSEEADSLSLCSFDSGSCEPADSGRVEAAAAAARWRSARSTKTVRRWSASAERRTRGRLTVDDKDEPHGAHGDRRAGSLVHERADALVGHEDERVEEQVDKGSGENDARAEVLEQEEDLAKHAGGRVARLGLATQDVGQTGTERGGEQQHEDGGDLQADRLVCVGRKTAAVLLGRTVRVAGVRVAGVVMPRMVVAVVVARVVHGAVGKRAVPVIAVQHAVRDTCRSSVSTLTRSLSRRRHNPPVGDGSTVIVTGVPERVMTATGTSEPPMFSSVTGDAS